VNVEIPPHVRDTATQLGAGVSYALKVVAGQLADDPDMGEPSGLPGILTVTVGGDVFEDCPALAIGYIREPDRIEIRYVNPALSAELAADDEDQDEHQPADPAVDAFTTREITDAWQRITHWLEHNAPDSHAALPAGVRPTAITALEDDLGVQIPADLRTLWSLTAGNDGVDGAGCLPGNQALMPLDAVAAFYRQQMDSQAHQENLNARRPEDDRITVWKATWIPVVSYGVEDRTAACTWTPRLDTWAAGPATTKAPATSSTRWSPIWKTSPTCSKPLPWLLGTSPAWSVARSCGAAGSPPRRKTDGSL
jgi:cell wall assembly regulator SMI1